MKMSAFFYLDLMEDYPQSDLPKVIPTISHNLFEEFQGLLHVEMAPLTPIFTFRAIPYVSRSMNTQLMKQISSVQAETNGFESNLLGLIGQFALVVTHDFEQSDLW